MRKGVLSDTEVIERCPEYQSIPMKLVPEILKVPKSENDFVGIKQIYRVVPPRPVNVNALATSLSQMGKNRAVPLAVAYPSVAGAIISDVESSSNYSGWESPPLSEVVAGRMVGMNRQQLISAYERGTITQEQLSAGMRSLEAGVEGLQEVEEVEGVRRVVQRERPRPAPVAPRRAGGFMRFQDLPQESGIRRFAEMEAERIMREED